MQTIGGYLIVDHRTCNGWHEHTVSYAFKDLDAAKEHVRARNAEISNRYFDEESGDSESSPTIHAVLPALFKMAQDRLSHNDCVDSRPRDFSAYQLGEAITRQSRPLWRRAGTFPYSYTVEGAEVFCIKSEAPARTAHWRRANTAAGGWR